MKKKNIINFHDPRKPFLPGIATVLDTISREMKTANKIIDINIELQCLIPGVWGNAQDHARGLICNLVESYAHETISQLYLDKTPAFQFFGFKEQICYVQAEVRKHSRKLCSPKGGFL